MKLILNDGSTYTIDNQSNIFHIIIPVTSITEAGQIYETMHLTNLSRLTIRDDEGHDVGHYTNFKLSEMNVKAEGTAYVAEYILEAVGTKTDPTIIETVVKDPVDADKAEGYDILTGEVE